LTPIKELAAFFGSFSAIQGPRIEGEIDARSIEFSGIFWDNSDLFTSQPLDEAKLNTRGRNRGKS
jgi:hypothetical protein